MTILWQFSIVFLFFSGLGRKQGSRLPPVKMALKRMINGKATGPDDIPVEAWNCQGEEGVDLQWNLIFMQEEMSGEWRDSVIVPVHKDKGDVQDCGNYRGIK